MKYNLFVDDQINDMSRADGRAVRDPAIIDPSRAYQSVDSYNMAINYMELHGCPDFISFDHDLGLDNHGNDTQTGYDVAKWLVEKDLDNPNWIPANFDFQVHSANPIGKKNIEGLLRNYLRSRL